MARFIPGPIRSALKNEAANRDSFLEVLINEIIILANL